jgi:hypothetical protein
MAGHAEATRDLLPGLLAWLSAAAAGWLRPPAASSSQREAALLYDTS